MSSNRLDRQLLLRVLARIQQHTFSNPIKIHAIVEEFGVKERQVKMIVEELRKAGYKIGSHKTKPYGLFIAKYPEEILDTACRIEQEGVALIQRARALRDFKSAEPTVFEQDALLPTEMLVQGGP